MKLDVQVRGRTVAQLYREGDEYLLKYLPDTPAADCVSLAMPVRDDAWRWPRDLHPFFRQNLPEGYLLNVIREEFGALLDGTDLSLLAVVGGVSIGRVTVTPPGTPPGTVLDPLDVESLLTTEHATEHFAELVRTYARAAISGAVPKFLAPESPGGDAAMPIGKPTLRTSRHIVKGSDASTPYLGFNEYYSMRVLDRLGEARVATTRMSSDGRLLVVDRFDVDPDGIPLYGVEDFCGLLGQPPHEKYATTTERVWKAAQAYLTTARGRVEPEQFGWNLLVNYVIRNADCHSKNIALAYLDARNVGFAPAYDLVTTQAYPRFANNPPALSIDGRKTWTPGKTLERFFTARLGIGPARYQEMVDRLCDAATMTGLEIIEASRNEPRWHGVSKQMLHAWSEGIASIRGPRTRVAMDGLQSAIAAAGFSDPEPPLRDRVVIGRSELLASRKK